MTPRDIDRWASSDPSDLPDVPDQQLTDFMNSWTPANPQDPRKSMGDQS